MVNLDEFRRFWSLFLSGMPPSTLDLPLKMDFTSNLDTKAWGFTPGAVCMCSMVAIFLFLPIETKDSPVVSCPLVDY